MLSEEEIINKVYKLRNVLTILNDYGKEDVEAIDGLLDLYNKEKKKNKELLNSRIGVDLSYDDYISKDKIREKIEEYKNTSDMGESWYTKQYIIETLEELLPEEGK